MKPLSGFLRGAALLLGSLALLAGCGGGDSDTTATASTGTLKLSITDAPACGYDNVFITVKEVRVHQSEDAVDGDEGWQTIPVIDAPRRIDLLELTNGVLEELGQAVLPAGKYTQMRLVLADNSESTPLANSVVLSGTKAEEPLKTPSGQQSGIKMNVDITVEPDTVADFVIDFDACKSVVKAGASGKYLLKPVVSVIAVISSTAQRIVGYLNTTTMGESTLVSAQKDGVVVKATVPDAITGEFVLFPVPVGTYDLVIVSSDHATAVMTGVPVTTTEPTYVSSATVRIGLAPSGMQNATGAVSIIPDPLNTYATVRALQALYNGPTVEVASMLVDTDSGAYGFALPIASPRLASYLAVNPLIVSNPAVSVIFPADSTDASLTAAGKYTLEASVAGLTTQTAEINLSGGPAETNFSFVLP